MKTAGIQNRLWVMVTSGISLKVGSSFSLRFFDPQLDQASDQNHLLGAAHTIQGLGDENEYLLVFDDGDFDKVG